MQNNANWKWNTNQTIRINWQHIMFYNKKTPDKPGKLLESDLSVLETEQIHDCFQCMEALHMSMMNKCHLTTWIPIGWTEAGVLSKKDLPFLSSAESSKRKEHEYSLVLHALLESECFNCSWLKEKKFIPHLLGERFMSYHPSDVGKIYPQYEENKIVFPNKY